MRSGSQLVVGINDTQAACHPANLCPSGSRVQLVDGQARDRHRVHGVA
jgi:hypothetical protein